MHNQPKRILREAGNYRVCEYYDRDADIENLKGDIYNPKCMAEMHGPDMTLDQLRRGEIEFEAECASEGVYGYTLERWNPEIGIGWEHVDSCWGFVGQFEETERSRYNHYIVAELVSQIPHQPGIMSKYNSTEEE